MVFKKQAIFRNDFNILKHNYNVDIYDKDYIWGLIYIFFNILTN